MHGPFQGAVNIFIYIILLCFLKGGLKFHKLQIHEVYIFSGYKIAYKHDSIFKMKILISIHNEKFYSKITYIYATAAAAAAKWLQSCPTLCDPIDSSPLGSSVSGILQARALEWGAISFSNMCNTHTQIYPQVRKGISPKCSSQYSLKVAIY